MGGNLRHSPGRALVLKPQRGSHLRLRDGKTNPFLSPLAAGPAHSGLATVASYGCCSAMMRGRCGEASDPETGWSVVVDPGETPMGVESAWKVAWQQGDGGEQWLGVDELELKKSGMTELFMGLGLSRSCKSQPLSQICIEFERKTDFARDWG
jgi:hypothetical protein